MISRFRFYDPFALIDITVGILLLYTQIGIPIWISEIHAWFLIIKGVATMISLPLPYAVFILGGFADVLSAAILYVGTPPILAAYDVYLAGFLLLKGLWTFLGMQL